jgi:arylsulfatase A-like enzyme
LSRHAGREVEIRVGSARLVDAAPGTPGWTHLHLVRVHRHERQHAGATAPNVLLLVVDTLRADALGCYGATPSPSPALDRLAASGLKFDDVVAHAPWTVPSVTSLLSGLFTPVLGVTIGADRSPVVSASSHLARTIPTLATLAQRAGISTFAASSNPLVGAETGLATGMSRQVDAPALPASMAPLVDGIEHGREVLGSGDDDLEAERASRPRRLIRADAELERERRIVRNRDARLQPFARRSRVRPTAGHAAGRLQLRTGRVRRERRTEVAQHLLGFDHRIERRLASTPRAHDDERHDERGA